MSEQLDRSKNVTRWQRIQIAGLVLTCILVLYGVRLAWLQLFGSGSTSADQSERSVVSRSIIQREKGIVLDDGRGRIVDRKGRLVTGKSSDVLVLFPVNSHTINMTAVRTISAWLDVDAAQLRERWRHAKEPFIASVHELSMTSVTATKPLLLNQEQVKHVHAQGWEGVRVLPYVQPYPYGNLTPHWIGFTSRMIQRKDMSDSSSSKRTGAAGLEQSFEPLLKSIGAYTYLHYTDALQTPLKGLDVRLSRPHNPYYPLLLHTTADMELHKTIDGVMRKAGIHRGAVVVLDVHTRDIVAMVSLPRFDPHRVDPYRTDWNNQALQAIAPGSIFKLAIAAAAIETGKTSPRETFTCTGSYGRYGLSCWLKEGHGKLTLEQAFEQSCNVVFAQLGERLTAAQIQYYADQLGFSGTVGMVSADGLGHDQLNHVPQEQKGRVFGHFTGTDTSKEVMVDGGIRAQSAIGQRDVRVTPLAAANVIVTLLQHGKMGSPRLVSKVSDAKGHTIAEFKSESKSRPQLNKRTFMLLLKWMQGTVEEGTGQKLRDRKWKLAGKSGTAQANAYGTEMMHSWFVGYGPVKRPRYAVAVVSENESGKATTHSHMATQVFGEVMDVLAAYEEREQ